MIYILYIKRSQQKLYSQTNRLLRIYFRKVKVFEVTKALLEFISSIFRCYLQPLTSGDDFIYLKRDNTANHTYITKKGITKNDSILLNKECCKENISSEGKKIFLSSETDIPICLLFKSCEILRYEFFRKVLK